MVDILAALEASPSASSGRRCKVQRLLDSIPDDSPGYAQLEATLTVTEPADPNYRPAHSLVALLGRLGCVTSVSTVLEHRAKRCVCNA